MKNFTPKFFSIVFIGRLNPQILNHDFLLAHNLLPKHKQPFQKGVEDLKYQFLSTQVLSRLQYEYIDIIIEEGRYQIVDKSGSLSHESAIIDITRNYFSLLKYTPFTVGGINFNGTLDFSSQDDIIHFENQFISNRDWLCEKFNTPIREVGLRFNFDFMGNQCELTINRVKGSALEEAINFNYEFPYKNIDSFLENLNNVKQVYDYFVKLLANFYGEKIRV